jgi:hypothetical protein
MIMTKNRGQIYTQGLFQMNPDGTGQKELCCNSSLFPTTILPSYYKGACSKLITILEQGHKTVEPSQEDLNNYDHFMKKRERMGR